MPEIMIRTKEDRVTNLLRPHVAEKLGDELRKVTAVALGFNTYKIVVYLEQVVASNNANDVEIYGLCSYTEERAAKLPDWEEGLKRTWQAFCEKLYEEVRPDTKLTVGVWPLMPYGTWSDATVELPSRRTSPAH